MMENVADILRQIEAALACRDFQLALEIAAALPHAIRRVDAGAARSAQRSLLRVILLAQAERAHIARERKELVASLPYLDAAPADPRFRLDG